MTSTGQPADDVDSLAHAPATARRADRPVVVVADDETHILDLLTFVIEDMGVEVIPVHNGEQALRAARERHPGLVISDVMMPRLSGDELCRRLRADPATAAIPIVLITAITPETIDGNAADELLRKPFDLGDVEAVVRRYLPLNGRGKR